MISPYHPELYTWLRVVKIRLAQVVNFRLTFRINSNNAEGITKKVAIDPRKLLNHELSANLALSADS